jgi:predicted amidohydrolase YtcJ
MRTKAPICENCTKKRLDQYVSDHGGYPFVAYIQDRNDFAEHKKLHRNDKWYKGVTPVYMKRTYIRETIKNKQQLKEYGYVCLECDKVIITMRKNVTRSSNYVRIVRK